MTEFKFYHDWGGGTYLELHSNRTLWDIDKPFNFNDYEAEVFISVLELESHFKNLEVFQLGRSGRHICVPDTPINRRRYKHLVNYANKLEQELINYFNNKYEMEEC